MDPPETRYAKSGDLSIAYQVAGSGPLDLVIVPGFVSNRDVQWATPGLQHFFSRLAIFSGLIRFDKRGTGLSDRMSGVANLEDRMDDVRAVMDAVGSQRAALFGVSEGGPMSLLFAATYPERTSALVLYGSYARHPTIGADNIEQHLEVIDRAWGTGEYLARFMAPQVTYDEGARRRSAHTERQSASPSAVKAILRMNVEIDARHILPMVRTPTLVLHRSGDIRITIDAGQYIADHVPGARLVPLPGNNHVFWNERDIIDRMVDETEDFLTGYRVDAELDRVLATVLFTDIVDSTKRAAALGDRMWRAILDRHDEIVRQQLMRFRGREVKHTGDGFLATFDGPARAVRCVSAIAHTMQPLGLTVRGGLHTGEIDLRGDDMAGSQSILRRVWRRWPGPARRWCRARYATSSPARACASRIAATTPQGIAGGGPSLRCPGYWLRDAVKRIFKAGTNLSAGDEEPKWVELSTFRGVRGKVRNRRDLAVRQGAVEGRRSTPSGPGLRGSWRSERFQSRKGG